MLVRITFALLLVVALLTAAHFYWHPPPLTDRTVSEAVRASLETRLGRVALAPPPGHEDDSGVAPLLDGPDAFTARIALIRSAEVALDVQYYIWQRDATGLILLDELRQAAERGVRVRLLLDDNGINGLDDDLAALAALPGIEIRLYNPFILRRPKSLGFVFDFVRLNRRMHNKSLTADGAVSILGGRNIGDIYFSFGDGIHYIDTDVVVAGPVVAEIGADFDRYWSSGSAHPVERIIGPAPDGAIGRLGRDASQAAASPAGQAYFELLQASALIGQLRSGEVDLEWTSVTLVSDDPAKGLGQAAIKDMLFPQLRALLSRPARSVDLVSAYFVPGRQFTELMEEGADTGVRIRILTNSQAATDVILVHSAYAHYRPQLLEAGIELYELMPDHAVRDEPLQRGIPGSSRASLHSKTLAVDGAQIFIGSFNFDPRSLFLNTEMGVLIESPRMAGMLADMFSERLPDMSYRPVLTEGGAIAWDETIPEGTPRRHAVEPGTNVLSRLTLRLLALLPIEWLL